MTTYYMQDYAGMVFTTTNPEYHKDCAKLTAKKGKAALMTQARTRLLAILSPGDTVYTVLRHASSSGMSRRISLIIAHADQLRNIDSLAAQAMDCKQSDKGGIVVGGCGMDMGFELVYNLGHALWPNGTPTPHGTRNGTPDKDGGYALKHEWI